MIGSMRRVYQFYCNEYGVEKTNQAVKEYIKELEGEYYKRPQEESQPIESGGNDGLNGKTFRT